jgi:GNAT superfamily N-acetyltransferase
MARGNNGAVSVRIRPTRDLELLARLRIEFLAEHRGVPRTSFSGAFVTATSAFLARMDQAGRIHSWVAQDGEQAVGGVSMLLHDVPPMPDDARTTEALVINMFVSPTQRRRGVGTSLLEACLRGGRERDVRRFYLRATESGRPLYDDAGFRARDDWMELRVPVPS